MKRFNLLMAVTAIVVAVTAFSCTTVGRGQDGYYDGQESSVYGNRVLVNDPYRGTIVLERDPRTGRYYEVDSYGYGQYGNPYYGNRDYDRRRYERVYSNPNYSRNNSGYGRNNNSTRGSSATNQRPTDDDRKDRDDDRRNRDEARNKVLGGH